MNPDEPTVVDATPPTHGHSPILESFRVLSALADAGIPEAVRAFQELLHREFVAPPEADRPELARLLIGRQSGKSATVYGSMVKAKTEGPA